jgi:hypothetical protein
MSKSNTIGAIDSTARYLEKSLKRNSGNVRKKAKI